MLRPINGKVFCALFLAGVARVAAAADAPADAPKVTYLRDVAPILNKVGCTSGPCHGAAKGKNGFKLSLRGYDPQFDYEALLFDLSGRRFNRAEPARSNSPMRRPGRPDFRRWASRRSDTS